MLGANYAPFRGSQRVAWGWLQVSLRVAPGWLPVGYQMAWGWPQGGFGVALGGLRNPQRATLLAGLRLGKDRERQGRAAPALSPGLEPGRSAERYMSLAGGCRFQL